MPKREGCNQSDSSHDGGSEGTDKGESQRKESDLRDYENLELDRERQILTGSESDQFDMVEYVFSREIHAINAAAAELYCQVNFKSSLKERRVPKSQTESIVTRQIPTSGPSFIKQ
ncbi:hypothetical protein MMC20_001956 [Loxospora ochrophaea]|nr:hypothetical protein [Loxospora ochrophaea]